MVLQGVIHLLQYGSWNRHHTSHDPGKGKVVKNGWSIETETFFRYRHQKQTSTWHHRLCAEACQDSFSTTSWNWLSLMFESKHAEQVTLQQVVDTPQNNNNHSTKGNKLHESSTLQYNCRLKQNHLGHFGYYRYFDRLVPITSEWHYNNTATLMGIIHAAVRD